MKERESFRVFLNAKIITNLLINQIFQYNNNNNNKEIAVIDKRVFSRVHQFKIIL